MCVIPKSARSPVASSPPLSPVQKKPVSSPVAVDAKKPIGDLTSCKLCERPIKVQAGSTNHSMRNHCLTHMPHFFNCEQCGLSSSREDNVQVHIWNKHGGRGSEIRVLMQGTQEDLEEGIQQMMRICFPQFAKNSESPSSECKTLPSPKSECFTSVSPTEILKSPHKLSVMLTPMPKNALGDLCTDSTAEVGGEIIEEKTDQESVFAAKKPVAMEAPSAKPESLVSEPVPAETGLAMIIDSPPAAPGTSKHEGGGSLSDSSIGGQKNAPTKKWSKILPEPSKELSGIYDNKAGLCQICGSKLSVSEKLSKSANADRLRHHAKVHLEPLWKCCICEHTGTTKKYIKTHMSFHHKDQGDDLSPVLIVSNAEYHKKLSDQFQKAFPIFFADNFEENDGGGSIQKGMKKDVKKQAKTQESKTPNKDSVFEFTEKEEHETPKSPGKFISSPKKKESKPALFAPKSPPRNVENIVAERLIVGSPERLDECFEEVNVKKEIVLKEVVPEVLRGAVSPKREAIAAPLSPNLDAKSPSALTPDMLNAKLAEMGYRPMKPEKAMEFCVLQNRAMNENFGQFAEASSGFTPSVEDIQKQQPEQNEPEMVSTYHKPVEPTLSEIIQSGFVAEDVLMDQTNEFSNPSAENSLQDFSAATDYTYPLANFSPNTTSSPNPANFSAQMDLSDFSSSPIGSPKTVVSSSDTTSEPEPGSEPKNRTSTKQRRARDLDESYRRAAVCKICRTERSFKDLHCAFVSLRAHAELHLQLPPHWKCKYCDTYATKNRVSVYKHVELHHGKGLSKTPILNMERNEFARLLDAKLRECFPDFCSKFSELPQLRDPTSDSKKRPTHESLSVSSGVNPMDLMPLPKSLKEVSTSDGGTRKRRRATKLGLSVEVGEGSVAGEKSSEETQDTEDGSPPDLGGGQTTCLSAASSLPTQRIPAKKMKAGQNPKQQNKPPTTNPPLTDNNQAALVLPDSFEQQEFSIQPPVYEYKPAVTVGLPQPSVTYPQQIIITQDATTAVRQTAAEPVMVAAPMPSTIPISGTTPGAVGLAVANAMTGNSLDLGTHLVDTEQYSLGHEYGQIGNVPNYMYSTGLEGYDNVGGIDQLCMAASEVARAEYPTERYFTPTTVSDEMAGICNEISSASEIPIYFSSPTESSAPPIISMTESFMDNSMTRTTDPTDSTTDFFGGLMDPGPSTSAAAFGNSEPVQEQTASPLAAGQVVLTPKEQKAERAAKRVEREANRHIILMEKGETVTCQQCTSKIKLCSAITRASQSLNTELRYHIQTHLPKNFLCCFCEKTSSRKSEAVKHMRTLHKKEYNQDVHLPKWVKSMEEHNRALKDKGIECFPFLGQVL